MPHHDDLSPALKALVDDAIEAAIAAKKVNGFRFPFLLLTGEGERQHRVLVDIGGTTATEIERGREIVRTESARLDAYVLGYDSPQAFLFEAGEKGLAEGFVFAQRYDLPADGDLVLLFGDGGFVRRTDSLL